MYPKTRINENNGNKDIANLFKSSHRINLEQSFLHPCMYTIVNLLNTNQVRQTTIENPQKLFVQTYSSSHPHYAKSHWHYSRASGSGAAEDSPTASATTTMPRSAREPAIALDPSSTAQDATKKSKGTRGRRRGEGRHHHRGILLFFGKIPENLDVCPIDNCFYTARRRKFCTAARRNDASLLFPLPRARPRR